MITKAEADWLRLDMEQEKKWGKNQLLKAIGLLIIGSPGIYYAVTTTPLGFIGLVYIGWAAKKFWNYAKARKRITWITRQLKEAKA